MTTTELFRQVREYETESLARRMVFMPGRPDTIVSRTHRITWSAEREVLCNATITYVESASPVGKRMVFPTAVMTWAKRSSSGQLIIGHSEPGRGVKSYTLWRGMAATDQEFAKTICRLLFSTVEVESNVMDKVLHLAQQTPSMTESHPFLIEWIIENRQPSKRSIEQEISQLSGGFAHRLAGVTDARQAVAALFGKRAVRKDMVKVLANSSPGSAELAWLVRDMRLLPVDHLVTLLRGLQESPGDRVSPISSTSQSTWRSLLHTLEPAGRKRLLKRLYRGLADVERPTRVSMLMNDTVTMARSAKKLGVAWPTKADSLTELHDLLSDRLNHYVQQDRQRELADFEREEARMLRREALIEHVSEVLGAIGDQLADHRLFWETVKATTEDQITQKADQMQQTQQAREQREQARRIARERQQNAGRLLVADQLGDQLESMGQDLPDSMGLVVARDADTLWTWGDTLSHCIGNYDHNRTTGRSILFGITHPAAKNDLQLLATGEVIIRVDAENQWLAALAQLYGHRNRELPTEQSVVIREVVEAAIAATEVTPEQIQAAAAA